MFPSDFIGLPDNTKRFVQRTTELGVDRFQIHGLFVLLGLYAGTPSTEREIADVFSALDKVVPSDRSKNLDEIVGDFYEGYDAAINEFCFRTGFDFKFRNVPVPKIDRQFSIVYLKDEGLLDSSISSIKRLADSSRLFDRFLEVLGQATASRNRSLLDSFRCGVFQIQLHAQIDMQGSRQIIEAIQKTLPLLVGGLFRTLSGNSIDYFIGLESGQIAILELMLSMSPAYAQQMWNFQSSLFFHERKPLNGVNEADPKQWHRWVLDRSEAFDKAYPELLTPFSESNATLSDLPIWGAGISEFEQCDRYIDEVWGFKADNLRGQTNLLEYKALLVHIIYASLTSSRESLH